MKEQTLDTAVSQLDRAERRFVAAQTLYDRVQTPVLHGLIGVVVEHRRSVAGHHHDEAERISEQHDNFPAQLAAYTAEQQVQLEPPQVD